MTANDSDNTAQARKLAEDALKAVAAYNWVGGIQIGLPNYTTLCAEALLSALDRIEQLEKEMAEYKADDALWWNNHHE